MAQQRRRTIPSSEEAAAGPTTRRLTLRGGKRERLDEEEEGDNSAEASRSGCKRPRMAQAGAGREEVLQDTQHDGGEDDGEESSERAEDPKEACPITDKHEKPFRLMDMPPEIRVEIYRACLTRPFHILLSKEPKPVDREKEGADSMLGTEERDRSVDSSGLDGSEDDVTLLHRGPDSGIGNPVDAAGGDNGGSQAWPGRYMRALRSMTRNNALRSAGPNAQTANNANDTSATPAAAPTHHSNRRALRLITNAHTNTPSRDRRSISSATVAQPRAPRPQDEDPLLVNLLRASKLVYKEARAILYGENTFLLDLDTAQPTLAALHQRSRGQIKDLRVTIPTHNDILEHFTEVIRLSIRYCWRLQRLVLNTPFVLPGAEGSSTSGNTTVYANAFDILRWLPKRTEVVLEGNVCEEIRRVVEKNSNLAKSLDELAYARRQLISNDGQQLPITGQEDFKRQPGAS